MEVGSIIEYLYTIDFKEHYVYESHWILSDSLKPFTSSYDPFHLRWTWESLPAGTAAPKLGPRGIVEMEARNIPAFQKEDFMPPEDELKARVDFTYDRELPENDPNKYWRQIGKKRNEALARHRSF